MLQCNTLPGTLHLSFYVDLKQLPARYTSYIDAPTLVTSVRQHFGVILISAELNWPEKCDNGV